MKIVDVLQEQDIIPVLSATTKDAVLEELAEKLVERHPDLDRGDVLKILHERERLGTTGIGDGIAIPHGKIKKMEGLALVFGRSPYGIEFNALDNMPAHLFFLLVAPEEAVGVHLKMLARISRILKDPALRKSLMDADGAAAIFNLLREREVFN